MQSLANYRQIAVEQFNDLIVLSQSSGNIEPTTDTEVWTVRILLGTLVVLVYWSMMEE
jgi:hypothetical protein